MRAVCCPERARLARLVRLLAVTALLAGCHSHTITPPGTPVVTMGNAANTRDFAAYIVGIDSITLTASDGTVAAPLVTPVIVDLTRLHDLAELVEAPAAPSATYTSATLTLDYTAASVWVYVNGQPTLATLQGPTGNGVSTYTITVTFDPAHPLVITRGVSTRMQVEIDLAASNSINTAGSSPTVTVQPFLAITPAPANSTELRARGLFVVTQPSANNFIMNLRPFYSLVSALGAAFVNVNASTYYNIEGVTYTGAAGLTALASQLQNSPVVVVGTLGDLAGVTPYINATAVYAGASQESPLADYATGTVSARTGDEIKLLGARVLTPLGNTIFFASFPVKLGTGTIVSQDGVDRPGLGIASISVGQRITVSGQPALDSLGNIAVLDATAGQVRLASTRVWGTLNTGATPGLMSLGLLTLDNFEAGVFDFAGTGTTGQDATIGDYRVSTGSFDASMVLAGTPMLAQGMVAPFGSAPPDFTANAVTPGPSTEQQLLVEWINGGSTQPFSSMSSAGLVVNLADANLGTLHVIRTGPTTLDLKTQVPASPLITTTGANQSNLVLVVGNTVLTTGFSVFNSASGFAAGLHTAFNGTNKIYRLVAYGQYNSNSSVNTFVASRIYVALHE